MFVGDDAKLCTRCGYTLIAIGTTAVSDDAKHLWYIRNDDKYRWHTAPALTEVNAPHFLILIYRSGKGIAQCVTHRRQRP